MQLPGRPVISFVWSPGERLPAGTGGSENFTIGHVRELNRRGIGARVVTCGLGTSDGRDEFDAIPFLSLGSFSEVSTLEGTVVFVSDAPPVPTRHPAYQVLHVPPPLRARQRNEVAAATRDRTLIATSRYAADLWGGFLDVDVADIHVVYPFAEPVFAAQDRPAHVGRRVLYAGRLTPEKGIYTLLAMLHTDLIDDDPTLTFTVTTAGADKPQGRTIERMLRTHPRIRLVEARTSPADVAALMAEHDVVVMPSNGQYWHETFGIVSIEAQHSGCRVVASDDGGLPETDCGALDLIAPDNSEALAHGILAALAQGGVPDTQRTAAATTFTVSQSVDQLLTVLREPSAPTPWSIVQELEEMVRLPSHGTTPHPAPMRILAGPPVPSVRAGETT